MKPLQPDIPTALTATDNVEEQLKHEDDLVELNIKNADISEVRLGHLTLRESLIEASDFTNSSIEKIEVSDCIFRGCSLVAANLGSSSWHATELKNSRGSGIQLHSSLLKNVLFEGCKLDLANFRFSTLENVIFKDCEVDEMDFYSAKLKNVSFVGCSIVDVEFREASLINVDLTQADIVTLKGLRSLKDAKINNEQLILLAPYLAQELGIRVVD